MKFDIEKLSQYDMGISHTTFQRYRKHKVPINLIEKETIYRLFYTQDRKWFFSLPLFSKKRSCIVRCDSSSHDEDEFMYFTPQCAKSLYRYGKTWFLAKVQ